MKKLLIVFLFLVSSHYIVAQTSKEAKKIAKVAMNKNDYQAAIPALKIILTEKPDDAKAHLSLSKAIIGSNVNEKEMIDFYNGLKVKSTKGLLPVTYKYKSANKTNYLVTIYEIIQNIDEKEPTSLNYLSSYFFETAKDYEKAYKYNLRKAKYVKVKQNFSYNDAGRAAMILEQWQNGLDAFNNALKKTDAKLEAGNYEIIRQNVMWAEREVRDEPMRAKLMSKPLNVEIENMGKNINSKWGDYYGAVTADESMFLFTSTREGSYGKKDATDGDWPEDFWYSLKDENGNWAPAKNLGAPINSGGHEGLPTLSADGQSIYFYMSGDKGDGNIYQSNIEGDVWSKPVKMEFCEDIYWETQPSISSDGNTIFFVSKRDKKDPKNADIFYSTRKRSGKWKAAKEVKGINTKYQEGSPFIHPDGKTLYFSSQGFPGVGGYDIFKSVLDAKGNWSTPVNVGYPINTRDSDNGFFINAMGTRAYYHSYKDGGQGKSDFYVVHLVPKPKKDTVVDNIVVKDTVVEKVAESVAASSVTTVIGVITDEATGESIGTTIEMQNLTTGERIQDFKSNSKTGKYVVVIPAGNNYAIAVSKKGYLFHSENFNIPESAASSIVTKNVALKKIEVGKSIVLNNIFFQTGSAELSTESTLELERIIEFMKSESTMKIEIGGHTDDVGSDASNQQLSEKRANSVVAYLTSKGIDSKRLIAKGYGETTPIASNETPEGKQLNRRTEFKVLEK